MGGGFILHNNVSHARFLPASSAHTFAYPTLALLLPLKALEARTLDLGNGWLFGYRNDSTPTSWAQVTGVRPEAYLLDQDTVGQSVRAKLEKVLERFELDARTLDDAWMLTMPHYLGIEGINPLTVFYCYKKGSDALWAVVLEVHNTFSERHVYVLPTGSPHEDKEVPAGFDHAWTFPRQFHVSPFNDRSGCYTCAVIAPPLPPSYITPSSLPRSSFPLPTVRIQLYTAHGPESPTPELKLIATLRPTSSAPLTSYALLAALASQPLGLLLTFPRIAYEAARLHYHRRLDVYARPEPRGVAPDLEDLFLKERNAVQRSVGDALGVGGGVGWQGEGALDRYARRMSEGFFDQRARELGLRITLVSTDPAYGRKEFPVNSDDGQVGYEHEGDRCFTEAERTGAGKHIIIAFRSPCFFSLLLACPSARHALLVGRDAEHVLAVTDQALFMKILSPLSTSLPPTRLQGFLQTLRLLPIPHTLLSRPDFDVPPVHPLDVRVSSTLSTLLRFFALLFLLIQPPLERTIFSAVRARFVPGDEPWGAWERAEEAWKCGQGGKESVSPSTEVTGERDATGSWENMDGELWVGSVRRPKK